jgi:hypothetical protein
MQTARRGNNPTRRFELLRLPLYLSVQTAQSQNLDPGKNEAGAGNGGGAELNQWPGIQARPQTRNATRA